MHASHLLERVRPLALVCASLLSLMSLAAGACDDEPSDEERIERLVEDVTGKVDAAQMDRALAYLALSELPVDVRVPHMSGVFDETRGPELASAYRRAMQRFVGSELRVRSQKIEVLGDAAEVRLTLVTQYGAVRVELSLRKLSSGWKVSRVRVDR